MIPTSLMVRTTATAVRTESRAFIFFVSMPETWANSSSKETESNCLYRSMMTARTSRERSMEAYISPLVMESMLPKR